MTATLTTASLLPAYARHDVTFLSGEGVWLTDGDGKRYLDLLAGIAVVSLGHCHPAPLGAAQRQLDALWHTSNLYSTQPMLRLAEQLSARFDGWPVAASAPWVRPWNEPSRATTTGFPVAFRAHFSDASIASVPELQKNARARPLISANRFASGPW